MSMVMNFYFFIHDTIPIVHRIDYCTWMNLCTSAAIRDDFFPQKVSSIFATLRFLSFTSWHLASNLLFYFFQYTFVFD